MIEVSEVLKIHKGSFLTAFLVILCASSVGVANGVQCTWNNHESAKIKWIPSNSDATHGEELRTEICKNNVNCKSKAVLITDPPQEEHELMFEYILEGDYRTKLSLYTDSNNELWSKEDDFANPKTTWTTISIKIPKNSEKLYLSGYVASGSNKIFLKGIGIPGVSKSCTDTPIKSTARANITPTKPTTTSSIPTITTSSTTTTTTQKSAESENQEENYLENDGEEKLQLQKVEVVAALATGFTKVVRPILCSEV